MTHSECVDYAYKWLVPKCHFAMPEFFTWNSELADVIGFGANGKSTMIECKVSRSDFTSDKFKRFRRVPDMGMGNFRYYCCPKGLIKPEELPEGWGLIYIYPSGHVKRVKEAKHLKRNMEAEHHLLYYYARKATFAGVHQAVLSHRMVVNGERI